MWSWASRAHAAASTAGRVHTCRLSSQTPFLILEIVQGGLPCILSRFTPLSRNCSQNVFFTTLSVSSRSHGRGRKKEAFANTCRAAHDWSVTSTINTQQAPDEACAHNAHMADLTTTAWPRLKWVIEHALTRPPTLHPTTAH